MSKLCACLMAGARTVDPLPSWGKIVSQMQDKKFQGHDDIGRLRRERAHDVHSRYSDAANFTQHAKAPGSYTIQRHLCESMPALSASSSARAREEAADAHQAGPLCCQPPPLDKGLGSPGYSSEHHPIFRHILAGSHIPIVGVPDKVWVS